MEILNTFTQRTDIWGAGIFITALLFIGITAIFIMIIRDDNFGMGEECKAALLILMLLSFMSMSYCIYNFKETPPSTYHDVIIYDIGEFDLEQYKIVSSRGRIIRIIEIDN